MHREIKLQEAFDLIWNHFIKDKQPFGIGARGACAYRGVDDSKCAVGVLITEEEYTPFLEHHPARHVFEELGWTFDDPHAPSILAIIQSHHDHCATINAGHGEFEERLRYVAEHHALQCPTD